MNQVKSKYRYMGFGLWENTDPTAPKPIKKPSPPPPPPKVTMIIMMMMALMIFAAISNIRL